ncbi:MAG TPA: hypothetical protein VLT79_00055 [Gemmatimonadales bacterium]|nr:hypothetical protein [Gemmatimonadales bacterium]
MRTLAIVLVLSAVALRAEAQQDAFAPSIQAAAALGLAAAPAPNAPTLAVTMEPATGKSDKRQIGSLLILIGVGAIATGAVAGGGGGTALIVGGVVCAGYGIYLHLSH